MEEFSEATAKLGIKIEKPFTEEKLSPIFYWLIILDLAFIALTVWLLILEWTGNPLPVFLKQLGV